MMHWNWTYFVLSNASSGIGDLAVWKGWLMEKKHLGTVPSLGQAPTEIPAAQDTSLHPHITITYPYIVTILHSYDKLNHIVSV